MITHSTQYSFSNLVAPATIALIESNKIFSITFDNIGNTDVILKGVKTIKAGTSVTFGGRNWAIIVDSFAVTFGPGTTPSLDIIKETLINL